MQASWIATQQKATAVKLSLFVGHGQFMCPTLFHAYQTQVFLHNTINGTLRYTNFPSNLSLSTVCLRKIFLAESKCFNFFNFVSSSSSAWTATARKTF